MYSINATQSYLGEHLVAKKVVCNPETGLLKYSALISRGVRTSMGRSGLSHSLPWRRH